MSPHSLINCLYSSLPKSIIAKLCYMQNSIFYLVSVAEHSDLSLTIPRCMPLCASVYLCLVVTCWEMADLLALVCGVLL